MSKGKYFNSYDFSTNPEHFSPEELETVRHMLEKGQTVYLAPLVIENEGQYETLHISRSACRYCVYGRIRHLIHFTPAGKEISDLFTSELEQLSKSILRQHRCLIPGTRKDYIRCPEENRCCECPFGKRADKIDSQFISLEALLQSGYEPIGSEPISNHIIRKDEYNRLMEELFRSGKKPYQAFILHMIRGYSVEETADMMQEKPRNIYYYLNEAKKILPNHIRALISS